MHMTDTESIRLNQLYVQQNYEDAFELATTLANSGNPEAEWILGNLYQFGIFVGLDLENAKKYLVVQ